jgi:Uma2 family endonuclease
MTSAPLSIRRWTRSEYDRLVDLGMLHGEAIELIGGQLVVAEPQGSYHATATGLVHDALHAVLPPGWLLRTQMPVALDDDSEPEPDVALVPGGWADYRHGHPTRPALVVEVAESSLAFDRQHKSGLYARGGVADYWIVNLIDRVLEVHRDPMPDPGGVYGWRYRTVQVLQPDAACALLALPGVRLAVGDLLPS